MAFLFGKKKDEPAKPGAAPAGGADGAPSPEKAQRFFQHARTVQDTENYEYAMQLWLSGLKQDPLSMDGLKAFFQCAALYLRDPSSRKGPGKEVWAAVSGSTDVDKYLKALLEWGMDPENAPKAVRALEAAAVKGLNEPGVWIGERAYGFVMREKKVRKDLLLKVSEAFRKLNAPDRALTAAESALKLDPTDGELGQYIRNLAASATMNRGGYEKTGQEGGFRQNIRDAGKQRELEEGDRISKTEDTLDRLVATAEEEFKKRPDDLPTAETLAKRLVDRGRGTDENRAHQIYTDLHQRTGQFRWRELSGDIRIRQQMRKIRDLQQMIEKAPGEEMLKSMLATEQDALLRLETDEYRLRVENYPTDLLRKFELGKRYYQLGKTDDAIALFQESQLDAKIRTASLNYLGQSFHRIQYFDEAIQTFRNALESGDRSPEVDLDLRYNLMVSLVEHGRSTRNAESLREADRLASSIAMKQFNFRDIRQRREDIKKLLGEVAPH